jgi:hypothetical protein
MLYRVGSGGCDWDWATQTLCKKSCGRCVGLAEVRDGVIPLKLAVLDDHVRNMRSKIWATMSSHGMEDALQQVLADCWHNVHNSRHARKGSLWMIGSDASDTYLTAQDYATDYEAQLSACIPDD